MAINSVLMVEAGLLDVVGIEFRNAYKSRPRYIDREPIVQ